MKKLKHFLKALKQAGPFASIRFFLDHLKRGGYPFLKGFYHELREIDITQKKDEKAVGMIRGLHQLLSKISFSIVVEANEPSLKELRVALDSAFAQTAPDKEVILFSDDAALIQVLIKAYPELKVNSPPEKDWVILLDQHEWLRVDLSYRYQQLIEKLSSPKALHAAFFELDHKGRLVPGTLKKGASSLHFPFEFASVSCYGLAFPSSFWKRGISLQELDLAGLDFLSVPLPLVGVRPHLDKKPKRTVAQYQAYFKAKGISWEVQEGLFEGTVRALPKLDEIPQIQVIVPFKEMKELTLNAVRSAVGSKGVKVHVTAVDNGSSDRSISEELKKLGVEVFRVEEPFNYSRLNNLAVLGTHSPQPLLFFLNNDALLDPEALLEMARWAMQPGLGLVGCRLHYPEGPLQHAGVDIVPEKGALGEVNWMHTDLGKALDQSIQAKTLRIPDAVTAAACMIRRDAFLNVGGFDEVLYPVAYSDTYLAQKLNRAGLKAFYTPYAKGVHFESVSRPPGFLEDFDRSFFLQEFAKG